MAKRQISVRLVIVLVLGAPALAAGAQERTVIGGVEVAADSPLAKNEHPRLLFRKRDLPLYRQRIAGPYKEDFERFKSYWDKKVAQPGYDWKSSESMDGIALGVLFQLTGDGRYGELVRKSAVLRGGDIFWSRWFALDLVFELLTREEIQEQARLYFENVKAKRAYSFWPALALYGGGTGREKEIGEQIEKGFAEAQRDLATLNEWARDRGGDPNSFSYIGNHVLIRLGANAFAITNALGRDFWQECRWLRHIGSYYVYHFMPWAPQTIHFDNTFGGQMGTGGDFGATYLLHAGPGRYQDGLYQWWVRKLIVEQDPRLQAYDKEVRNRQVMSGFWGRLLFHDLSVPELGPENFPPSRLFRTKGMASMRENWDKNATFVHFRSGAWGDLGDGRHNADNNTFTIYKKGILALDSGAQQMSALYLKFELSPGYGPNSAYYASETLAQNGILVHHPVDDPFWKNYGKPNTGGQILRSWPREWRETRGYKEEGEIARRGKILAWETSPEYDYVCGDATLSHSPTTVSSYTRQMVYVRPDLVFVYDRVETAREGCKTTWLLHTADRPKIDGKESPDKRIHPDGHFLWEGSTVAVTDEERGGRMYCKMLLPAKRELRLLGGENHEFELPDGRNPGPTAETYRLPKDSGGVRHARAEGVGLRGWRVEVEDRTGVRSVRFLHVLQTSDGAPAMAPCELVRGEGTVGAKVMHGGRAVTVQFRDAGTPGGEVRIENGPKGTLRRALADDIQDHYSLWKDHPDYPKWMSDPFRQSVISGGNPPPTNRSERK